MEDLGSLDAITLYCKALQYPPLQTTRASTVKSSLLQYITMLKFIIAKRQIFPKNIAFKILYGEVLQSTIMLQQILQREETFR